MNPLPYDHFWDDYHRKRGQMTNEEFFTTNGPGSFNEGCIKNENGKWIPDPVRIAKEEREYAERHRCSACGDYPCKCEW